MGHGNMQLGGRQSTGYGGVGVAVELFINLFESDFKRLVKPGESDDDGLTNGDGAVKPDKRVDGDSHGQVR